MSTTVSRVWLISCQQGPHHACKSLVSLIFDSSPVSGTLPASPGLVMHVRKHTWEPSVVWWHNTNYCNGYEPLV